MTGKQILAVVLLLLLILVYVCWFVGAMTSDNDTSDKFARLAFIALLAFLIGTIFLG